MNKDTLAGILRALLAAAAGFAAGKGIDLSGLNSPEFTNALILVGVAVWSVFAKKPAPSAGVPVAGK
jgi:hypothetical protein